MGGVLLCFLDSRFDLFESCLFDPGLALLESPDDVSESEVVLDSEEELDELELDEEDSCFLFLFVLERPVFVGVDDGFLLDGVFTGVSGI